MPKNILGYFINRFGIIWYILVATQHVFLTRIARIYADFYFALHNGLMHSSFRQNDLRSDKEFVAFTDEILHFAVLRSE